jgi:O-antigen ligase
LNAAVEGFFDLMRRMDIQSRFIQKLLDGTLSEDSGRSEINRIAFDMIRNGGIFGYGFYGDRYVIGQTWHYGYPHNIFLEWLIEFGPLLGGVFCLLFMFNVVRMGIRVIDPTWTFLWILFISTNMKLIVSDSFWYYWPFWGLLSVLGLWNKENRSSPIPKKGSSIIPVP